MVPPLYQGGASNVKEEETHDSQVSSEEEASVSL
jgi:hypothetical protein